MFRKVMLSISLLLLILNFPQVCAQRTVVTRGPYYNQYNQRYINSYHSPHRRNYYTNGGNNSENFTDTSVSEGYALGRNYMANNNMVRLQRLERQIFGAVQQGDFDERFQRVREAVAIRQPQRPKKTVMRKIGDYFAGQLTGFEPSLSDEYLYDSNNPTLDYNQGFGKSSLYSHGTSPWNQGYRVDGYGMGNSGSIRILD